MAYKTTYGLSCANRQVALDEMWTQIDAMGWTLVDGNFTSITMAYTAVNATDNTFTTTSGSVPQNATPCQITTTGTVPAGLSINTLYYVVNRTDTTFKLSTSYNGSAIDITTQGTGNHTISEAFRIYKSNGENSDKVYEYVYISYYTANAITFTAAYLYNITTKSLSARASTSYAVPALPTSQSGFYLFIYGNKNIIFIGTKVSTTFYKVFFGHMIPFTPLVTDLSSPITTGSSVTVTVTDTSGFESGYTYQIVGAGGEGRDDIIISSIISSTQMVITTLLRNYSSGSKIGVTPSTFGISRLGYNTFYTTCPGNIAGLTDANVSYGVATNERLIDITYLDPDPRTQKYILQPLTFSFYYYNTNTSIGILGYADNFLLLSPVTGLTSEDTFTITKLDSGISSGSNSSTTINDTTKSWTTNTYAGKVLVISFGTGVGQIKKITSNSSNQLVLESGWTFSIIPDATSQYTICNSAYRYLYEASNCQYALREGY